MKETTENNILLAEFLDMLTTDSEGNIKEDVNSFKFHNYWNWLMEVVEKINDLGHVVTIRSSGYVQIEGEEIPFIIEEDGDNPLQSTYDACVEFVKWYNKNKQQ